MNREKLNQILLIDDDEPVNFLHEMIIKSSKLTDAKIEIKMLAQQGLDFLKKQIIDEDEPLLIFLDINMPRMNGWEFLDEFESMPSELVDNTIVVMLTTSLNPDDKSRGEKHPAVKKFMTKPLTKDGFQNVLEEFFPN
ncbi:MULTISPECIES: two-component system response regulator [unclassified Flammeovirga]|uniref:response regulator n=1 Tax=unclassified Flammeovirga TaxID=2637820 RepID=UPI0005C692B1|nr:MULTISPECIES: response regulator [unclassified Flammeovirga]MBD0403142.1 response regulator [Flammeovirga sp. EKP202]